MHAPASAKFRPAGRIAPILAAVLTICSAVRAAGPKEADPLEARLRARLAVGRLDQAALEIHEALRRNPDDPALRERFVAFHLSLARTCIEEQQYRAADSAARAVLSLEPAQPQAIRIRDGIDAARRAAPQRVREARRMIELELFAPAYETLSQAVALTDPPDETWTRDLWEATEGAGDDHYVCRNFASAFYFYDALMLSGRPIAESLRQRWLRCLTLALAAEGPAARRPAEFWGAILDAAERGAAAADRPIVDVLRGLAAQRQDRREAAANAFRAALRSMGNGDRPATLEAARQATIREVERRVAFSLSSRRRGWNPAPRGAAQPTRTVHFILHDAPPDHATALQSALEYHFDRLTRYFGDGPAALHWPRLCDVFFYSDAASLRAVLNRPDATRGCSIMRARGGRLLEHSLHLTCDDPLLLSATIPHELSHLVVGALTGWRELPPLLSEGLALQCEPACRAQQFRRVLSECGAPPSLEFLLRRAPPASQNAPGDRASGEELQSPDCFYARAGALTERLRERVELGAMIRAAASDDPAGALARAGRFKSLGELERWLRSPEKLPGK